MIGRTPKVWAEDRDPVVGELSQRDSNACRDSIAKWDEILECISEAHDNGVTTLRIEGITESCGMCEAYVRPSGCIECPLFTDEPCYLRDPYMRIFVFSSDDYRIKVAHNTELASYEVDEVKDYAEKLIAYLMNLKAYVDEKIRHNTESE